MIIDIGISPIPFKKKPEPSDIPKIYHSMKNAQIDAPMELAKILCNGQSVVSCAVTPDRQFSSTQTFFVDFDGVSYEDAIAVTKANHIYPSIQYCTFSQPPDEPWCRFRFVFLSDHKIENLSIRDVIADRFMQIYEGLADTKCRNYGRMFFGGREPIVTPDAVYNFEKLWGINETAFEGGLPSKK